MVAKSSPVVAREARMLTRMREIGVPVPKIYASTRQHLLMEYLGEGAGMTSMHWESMSTSLARLAQYRTCEFGWDEDYALRHIAVPNHRCERWTGFWRDNRLLCHVPHLRSDFAQRIEALCDSLTDLIPAYPPTALVHGDLWGGNLVAGDGGQVWLIDPCAYYGDREVDVATLTVFDRPPDSLFDQLDLEPGWRDRLPVYRLWTWLVHIRLFGEAYRPAAERDLSALGF